MEPKEDEKWNRKSTVIVAQKKQDQKIGTTNLEGLNSRGELDRVDHRKISSATQDMGDMLH